MTMLNPFKNYAIAALALALGGLSFLSYHLAGSLFAVKAELNLLKQRNHTVMQIGLENYDGFAQDMDKLSQHFLNNRYILNNTVAEKALTVREICQQQNGVKCVISDETQIKRVGN